MCIRDRTTLVARVIAAETAWGTRLPVSSQTSANTTVAPSTEAQLAVDTKVSGVVTTSSPAPTPRAAYATCKAAVPDVTDTARETPHRRARSSSNAVTAGPVVNQSPRRTFATASMSDSSTD